MSQVIEPALADYARFYGLTCNHLEIDPLAGLLSPEDAEVQLQDGPQLFHIDETVAGVPEERLLLGKDEVLLLTSITRIPKRCSSFDGVELDPRRVQKMKLELPLLTSDHEVDMQRFTRVMVPDLANEHLPLESLDEEADEGLSWPSTYAALPDLYLRKSSNEKLEVSPMLLSYMRNTLDYGNDITKYVLFEDVKLPTNKKSQTGHVTPPLLPMSPSWLPYEPSSETGRLELLSEPLSPALQELKAVDQKIFESEIIQESNHVTELQSQDTDPMLLDSDTIGEVYSPLRGIKDPPSSPPTRKPAPRNLKVEAPLTPLQSAQPPPWKRKNITYKEAIREVIPVMPSPIASPEDVSIKDLDSFFEKDIAPMAIKAERSIEQEQLQEADTMSRVPVPVMNFSLPTAPWKIAPTSIGTRDEEENIQKRLLALKTSHFSKHNWPGNGESERSLQWMPFPAALGRVETYETIVDDIVSSRYLAIPECMDSSTLTWKPDGLRLFDDLGNSDEEELEEGTFPEPKDIESLVKKRKRELQQEEQHSGEKSASWTAPKAKPVNHDAFRKVPKLLPRLTSRPAEDEVSGAIVKMQDRETDKPFSALESLENFISLRRKGSVKSTLTAEHHFSEQKFNVLLDETGKRDRQVVMNKSSLNSPLAAVDFPMQNPGVLSTETSRAHTQFIQPAFAAPEFAAPTTPMPFVVSTSFLRDRKLARLVQRLLPSSEFTERDFTLHSSANGAGTSIGTSHKLPAITMADEADIILSPSTCLVLTTLQKIKQRSLPGQRARSALRERITRVAPRYEKLLIVLANHRSESSNISNPMPSVAFTLDQNDCEAVIEFTSFCTRILEETQVIITNGGSEHLAQWIASLMVKHCIQTPEIKLLQDETLWEIFLRRAGMNAFAAQVILSELKAPLDTAQGENNNEMNEIKTAYGLTAFVKMSLQERIARFELLLGGRRVLERVSRVLDARW